MNLTNESTRTKSYKKAKITIGTTELKVKFILFFKNQQLIYQYANEDKVNYLVIPFSFFLTDFKKINNLTIFLDCEQFMFKKDSALINLSKLDSKDSGLIESNKLVTFKSHTIKFLKKAQLIQRFKLLNAFKNSTNEFKIRKDQLKINQLKKIDFCVYFFSEEFLLKHCSYLDFSTAPTNRPTETNKRKRPIEEDEQKLTKHNISI